MPDTPRKFYLTTPIYYVNARPHIGHAYTTLVADTIARRHRLLGDDTFFLTGTDEHGQKIERSAAAAGIQPQQFADEVSAAFKGLWDRMGLTYNDYIRTTEPRHKQGAQKLFANLHASGQIYLSSYTGQYSVGEEMFVDGPPGAIGPDGKPTETLTEENFFFKLSAWQLPVLDLIESDTLLIQPESRKNEVLSFIRGNVAEATEKGEIVALSAAGKPYVPGALRDLSVSRSGITWGIPVPEPAASETRQQHVIYVWLDALANYMTAVGYGSDAPEDIAKFERFWPADLHLMSKEITRFHCIYWPAFLMAANLPLPKAVTAHGWLLFNDSKMSKSGGNIVRTETILDTFGTLCPANPAPLLSSRSAAEGSAPPDLPQPPSKREQDLFATDVLRYHLLREIPFGQDGSFTFDAMITRYNADLANGYGNLVSRTLALVAQNLDKTIPEVSLPYILASEENLSSIEELGLQWPDPPRVVFAKITKTALLIDLTLGNKSTAEHFAAKTRFDILAQTTSAQIANVDSYLSSHAPWKLAKSSDPVDRKKMIEVLYTAAESIRIITALLYPILPHATAKVWLQLGLGDIEEAARKGQLNDLKWGGLQPGTKLGPLAPIFPRADKGLAQIMIDLEASNAASKAPKSNLIDEAGPTTPEHHDSNHPGAAPRTGTFAEFSPGTSVGGSHAVTTERVHTSHTEAPASGAFATDALATATPDTPQIAIDDFVKIDLRVAKILVAERIPKADKLLRLEVDLGYETRQILSGIAEWYTPEELIGRRIVIIANLAPRKMRGLESHGMLLAASSDDNTKPILTTFPDTEALELGARVR